jgi:Immunoglobulin I-set domain/Fibronectin type III domain
LYLVDVTSAPGAPKVVNLTFKSVELTWDAPFKDGGSPVMGYILEQRVGKSTYWRRVTKTSTTKTTHEVTEVLENENYEFRVVAENKKGLSAPSDASERVKIPAAPMERKPPRPSVDMSLRSARASPLPARDRNIRAPSEMSSRRASREHSIKDETIGSDFSLSDEEAELPEFEESMNKPEFIKHLENITCTEGEMVALRCEVIGNPAPTALWYKDGKVIRDAMGYQHIVQDSIHKLIIKEAFPEDSAIYKIVAQNGAGKAESSCFLKVKHREQLEERGLSKPPKITQPLTDKAVGERDQIYLEVKVESASFVTFKWYVLIQLESQCFLNYSFQSSFRLRDGTDITYNENCVVKTISKSSYLVLSNCKATDTGRYKCIAQNVSGSVETSANITVQGLSSKNLN